MASYSKKINFKALYNGKELNFKNVKVNFYGSESGASYQSAYAPMGAVSSVIRQFVKQVWPDLKFNISSDSFAGGDSVSIYLAKPASKEKIREIDGILSNFERGNFNGMIDLYEYKANSGISTVVDGIEVKFSTKYLTVNNSPKYGTKEYDAYWNERN